MCNAWAIPSSSRTGLPSAYCFADWLPIHFSLEFRSLRASVVCVHQSSSKLEPLPHVILFSAAGDVVQQ
jgi:hypothetical protein